MLHGNNDSYHRILSDMRETLRAIYCVLKPPIGITPRVTISGAGIVSFTVQGDFIMATVVNTGGPLNMDVSDFVSDSGNPVKDTDPAVYSSSDDTIATVVNDPNDAQDGVITLTGKNTDPETTVVITAAFPAQRGGNPFSVVANLVVIDPAAAGAQAKITGPGVVAEA